MNTEENSVRECPVCGLIATYRGSTIGCQALLCGLSMVCNASYDEMVERWNSLPRRSDIEKAVLAERARCAAIVRLFTPPEPEKPANVPQHGWLARFADRCRDVRSRAAQENKERKP